MTSSDDELDARPTIRTTLNVLGDFEPSWVSDALGTKPTRTWRKGDLRGASLVLRYSEDGWAFEISCRASLHVDEELAGALDMLRSRAHQLKRVTQEKRLRAQLAFAVDVAEGQAPSVSFSAVQLGELAELGLSIDIDIALL